MIKMADDWLYEQAKGAGRLSRTTQIALEAQRRRSKLRLAELSAQEQASRQATDQTASASGASGNSCVVRELYKKA